MRSEAPIRLHGGVAKKLELLDLRGGNKAACGFYHTLRDERRLWIKQISIIHQNGNRSSNEARYEQKSLNQRHTM
jgi:hypothetical protein